MKKYLLLVWLALVMTSFTSHAQSYNIHNGSISLVRVDADNTLKVTQNGSNDIYYAFNKVFTNIVISGNSTPSANTITIYYPDNTYKVVITLSNLVIQTTTATPIEIQHVSNVELFLATGTSNVVKTTAKPTAGDEDYHPAILVRSEPTSTLTIKGGGVLVAEGGESSAGIGGDWYGGSGEIKIEGSATVIATGGMGAAGIGGGEARPGGDTSIYSNAVVIAKGGNGGTTTYWGDVLGGAAGIGGGGPSSYNGINIGGSGGNITISDNARVTAYAGVGASAIGSGGSAISTGNISIGVSNKVVAVSDGTRSAIDDDTLGGNGYVLQANYQSSKNAGVTSAVRRYITSTTYVVEATITPTNSYKSFACSVSRTNAFRLYAGSTRQEHQTDRNFTVLTTGLTNFTDVTDSGRVVVTLDKNGGSGGSDQVVAVQGNPMPSATGPTNSNTFLSFAGYYLLDGTTKYYNANMSSARNCDILDDFTLYAKWLDSRIWDGTSRSYTWYTNGTNPYIVSTAAELAGLAYLVNGTAPSIARETFAGKSINLVSCLDLTNYTWTAIGNYAQNSANIFQGSFNGRTNIISGLKISTNLNYQSLFGYIGSSATISNLIVSGSITASNYVGGLVGYNNGGALLSCVVSGSVQGVLYVGGLAGSNTGLIQNCLSSGTVSGNDYVGGIVGGNTGTVQNVRYFSTVTSLTTDARVGGIAGYNAGQIHNGLMLGSVTYGTSTKVGRVVGENFTTGSITNGYYLNGASPTNAVGASAGSVSSLGRFQNAAGILTPTDGTSLGYGTQLHLALNKWVYFNNPSGKLLWWTTSTNLYPELTTNRPPFTLSTSTPVPFSWLAQNYPLASQSAYESLAVSNGVNNIPVWNSYVAGLSPTNAQSTFLASISFTNGTPYVSWTPNLLDRTYTVQGKTNLTASSWGATNSASRFFKVSVDLP
jgi:hypothetical protein